MFSGPRRGSHLDQFIAIVKDNELGHYIGMPSGGYSNTWEWEETLTLAGYRSGPVVQVMYNIGHTIRPNGEVLEGNPALPDREVLAHAGQRRRVLRICSCDTPLPTWTRSAGDPSERTVRLPRRPGPGLGIDPSGSGPAS